MRVSGEWPKKLVRGCFWPVVTCLHRQQWVDDCLSPPATIESSPPIMLTKRAGKIRWNRWAEPLQAPGKVQCKRVVSTNAIRWSSGVQFRSKATDRSQAGSGAQRFASQTHRQPAIAGAAQANRQTPFNTVPADQYFAHRTAFEHHAQCILMNAVLHPGGSRLCKYSGLQQAGQRERGLMG